MKVKLIQIGNYKGIRLSKTIIEKYNLKEKVNLILEKGQIIIMPIESPRNNWEKAFQTMAKQGDDNLLINDVYEDENLVEWN